MTSHAAPVLPYTGERLVPQVCGDVALEHLHRYALARELAAGKDVLDIASGEGYGSQLLAQRARAVVGVDVSPEAVDHARRAYRRDNLTFEVGPCETIPLAAASVDLVVSFETIEHVANHEEVVREFKRVLRPGGLLVISTPDRAVYSEEAQFTNPYHVKEMNAEEFRDLLSRHFDQVVLWGQRIAHGSVIAPLDDGQAGGRESFVSFAGDFTAGEVRTGLSRAKYLVGVATCGTVPAVAAPSLFEGTALGTDLEVQVRQVAEQRRQLAELEHEKCQRDALLQALYQSWSWRMTAPLRGLRRMLGGR